MKNKKEVELSLDAMCEHITNQEIKSAKASRDSIKYMHCIYMEENIGRVYKGIVCSIVDYGIFVELIDTKTEGLIKTSTITGNWSVDITNHCIKENNTGEIIRLSDEVTVMISSVELEKRNINFSFLF
jgi:ribonuclease R